MTRRLTAPKPIDISEARLVSAVKQAAKAMNVYVEWAGQRKAKGAGNTVGLPDCFVYVAGRCIPVELKTPTGNLSDDQALCLLRRQDQGVRTEVVRSQDEFVALVNGARRGT